MASATEDFTGTGSLNATNWDTTNGANIQRSADVAASVASTDNWVFWKTSSTTFTADHYSEAVISTTTATDNHALAARVATGGTKDFYLCDAGATKQVAKFVSGTFTVIGATGFTTVATNDTIRISVSGTTISYIKNGATVTTRTDAAIASGQPGIFFSTTDGRMDDWAAADVTSAASARLKRLMLMGVG